MNSVSRRTAAAARATVLTVTLLVVFAADVPAAVPGDPHAARRRIERIMDQYFELQSQGDASRLASLYAEDAVLLPPERPIVAGRAAIRQFWWKNTSSNLRFIIREVHVGGELAYLVATYMPPGARILPGKCVILFRLEPAGWKIAAEIWNNDFAP